MKKICVIVILICLICVSHSKMLIIEYIRPGDNSSEPVLYLVKVSQIRNVFYGRCTWGEGYQIYIDYELEGGGKTSQGFKASHSMSRITLTYGRAKARMLSDYRDILKRIRKKASNQDGE